MSDGERITASNEELTEWTLWRQDSNDNQFRIPGKFNDQAEASAAQEMYAARGHHQTYFTRLMSVEDNTTLIPGNSE